MKTTLTAEQSAELIKHGVDKDKASLMQDDDRGRWPYPSVPIFTLADLLSLLPKEIKRDSLDRPYVLHIIREEDRTIAAYRRDWDSITGADKRTSEFIDSLYELLLWAIDNNHVKLD